MNLLGFETSSAQLSVALWRDGDVSSLELLDVRGGASNSELALPTMHRLFAKNGISLQDIDAIVFGQGPGAFTGVRIACGIAQGLGFGLGLATIGLPSTLALAERSGAKACLVAIDARMNEVYLAAYERDETEQTGWRVVIAPCLSTLADLPALPSLPSLDDGRRYVGIGSAFDQPTLSAALMSRYTERLAQVIALALPDAASLLRVAARQYQAAEQVVQDTHNPRNAVPLYLRNNVALTIDERAALKAVKAETVAAAGATG